MTRLSICALSLALALTACDDSDGSPDTDGGSSSSSSTGSTQPSSTGDAPGTTSSNPGSTTDVSTTDASTTDASTTDASTTDNASSTGSDASSSSSGEGSSSTGDAGTTGSASSPYEGTYTASTVLICPVGKGSPGITFDFDVNADGEISGDATTALASGEILASIDDSGEGTGTVNINSETCTISILFTTDPIQGSVECEASSCVASWTAEPV